ncbi:MAG: FecR domain-containing protein [Akkermansiaceae bacterium]|nr:FecR domain-containing protein [Akkermansiaceae bacterium]
MLQTWLAVAACVALGLMALRLIFPAAEQPAATAISSSGQAEPAEAELVVYLTRAEGELLCNGEPLEAGQQGQAGFKPGDTLTLERGLLELDFRDSDVHAIAIPPLKLTVLSNMGVRLDEGELKLHVPPQGIGFEVETQKRKIVDLGTSFVVSTVAEQSHVLVLDGKVSVEDTPGGEQLALVQGEVASFRKGGRLEVKRRALEGLPDLSANTPGDARSGRLRGRFFAFADSITLPLRTFPPEDHMGHHFVPLVKSGFSDESALADLVEGRSLAFDGIAGAHNKLADYARTEASKRYHPWMMWYQGKVKAPKPGRYRYWGYADNSLLVAINGKAVFNGSRFDTALREELPVKSERHPSFPCLNSKAGIASGEWIELGDEPVQIDILFGEVGNRYTAGILMIEREGDEYPNTYWGQPQWPLFLTQEPSEQRAAELKRLNHYLENNLKGSFSIPDKAVWQVVE